MNRRVLVCEDDRAIRVLLDKLLIRHGLSPQCVASGIEAVARLRRETFDLVVLDLLTPGLSGYEVLEVLGRERPDLLQRVVVLTASQRALSENLPVAATLRKPFDLDELDGVIERILSRSRVRDSGEEAKRVEGEVS
jgi:two-component system response regulator MprA